MNTTTVGVDLAKNVFVACVADGAGRVIDTREFNRAAIVAALLAPGMRFIAVKTEAQQQRLAWHSLRLGWVEERTALLNRIRGLLAEFGMVVDIGAMRLRRKLAEHEFDTAQPAPIRHLIQSVRDQLDGLDLRIAECDRQIAARQADDALARRARELPGVGMLTADAVVASVGDAATLRKSRTAPEALTRLQQWIVTLNGRVGYHKTLVAIANKHARQLWAVLAKGEAYNSEAWHQWHESVEQPAS